MKYTSYVENGSGISQYEILEMRLAAAAQRADEVYVLGVSKKGIGQKRFSEACRNMAKPGCITEVDGTLDVIIEGSREDAEKAGVAISQLTRHHVGCVRYDGSDAAEVYLRITEAIRQAVKSHETVHEYRSSSESLAAVAARAIR